MCSLLVVEIARRRDAAFRLFINEFANVDNFADERTTNVRAHFPALLYNALQRFYCCSMT